MVEIIEPTENPFELVYDEIWRMLIEDPRLSEEAVKLGNRIRLNENNRNIIKKNLSSADYPELLLLMEGLNGVNLCATSSSTMITRVYSWVISSGDFRIEPIAEIEWIIFTGLTAWRHRLSLLSWLDELFVKRVNFISADMGQRSQSNRPEKNGFISVWSMEVEMHFQTSKLEGLHLNLDTPAVNQLVS